jgi:hypothetical protein
MMRALFVSALLLNLQAPQPSTPAPPAGTDIYELAFDGTLDGLKRAKVQPVVTERGYDNQPFYTPDAKSILFTAIRTGNQTDIYEFDRAARTSKPLITTPEGEYSPTITPDGGISVIRVEADKTQRLWRFDRAGRNPKVVLTDIKPVGYHVWIDGDTLALFVLGPPATLQIAHVGAGKADIVARDIGRSLQRIPGNRNVSFVQRDSSGDGSPASADFWVNALNPQTGAVTALVKAVAGSNDRDCAWLPDGALLMSAGTKIFSWRPSDKEWKETFDGAAAGLGAITRMAVSPDGKSVAVVVAEKPAAAAPENAHIDPAFGRSWLPRR